MTSRVLPRRDEVPLENTWDLASIFADEASWQAAFDALEQELPGLARYRGHLGDSATMLLEWLQTLDRLGPAAARIAIYTYMLFDTDTTNQHSAALLDRAQGLMTRFAAASAFAEPELVAIAPAEIERFMTEAPALRIYHHYFDNLQRRRDHIRSPEVEELLAQASDPLNTARTVYILLTDADLTFDQVHDSQDQPSVVAQGSIEELLHNADRALRKRAWEAYADGYLRVKNSMGGLIAGNVKASIFNARARHYPSAHAAALAEHNIPAAVYNNVIDSCNRHLPIWHRYWELRRRALGLATIEPCDIFAPLVEPRPDVAYQQAIEWICAGMAPLGQEYVRGMRAGLTEQRWVDIYPNLGKPGGAYSGGAYGTHPFILMNYTGDLQSMSTLAHELGHSMHTNLTNATQPYIYSHYSLFSAEVASNFNQALVRAYLLGQNRDRAFQIAVIEEAMENFHRYLFLMPILAQFEFQIHQLAEQGEALTADIMSNLMVDLFRAGYGSTVTFDAARAGITWAQFPHLFANFYVFQYASGIAAANALAAPVLAGEAGAAQRYLAFLSAGGSAYPLDALRQAGVDLTTPEPMERAFGVLEQFVERLEDLLGAAER